MPRRAANFIPPQRRPEASPAITLFIEPEDPIRIMGEMIRDADLIHEKLRGLAFSLVRGPLTTGDLIEKIGGPTKTIYQTLSILRGELLIVMLEDRNDGQRKNYLRNQAEAMATG